MPIPACPVPIGSDGSITQPLDYYTYDDHVVWKELFMRQTLILKDTVCNEFLYGLNILPFDSSGVPNLETVSDKLYKISKFRLVPVGGLISSQTFFQHLANRYFTVGWFVRQREQMDYLEEPDLFHDLYGHVPMLTNPVYADFMQRVGLLGLEIMDRFKSDPKKQEIMANALLRLYWFTVEFGLIGDSKEIKVYGAGIASSYSEVPHALYNPKVSRVVLNSLERVVRTKYYIDKVQPVYFVIPSLDELFNLFSDSDLITKIVTAREQPMYPVGTILETDQLI